MALKPTHEMNEDELVEALGTRTYEDPRTQEWRARLALLTSRAQSASAKALVEATGRLACATWALVGVTLLLTIAAIVQAIATLRSQSHP